MLRHSAEVRVTGLKYTFVATPIRLGLVFAMLCIVVSNQFIFIFSLRYNFNVADIYGLKFHAGKLV